MSLDEPARHALKGPKSRLVRIENYNGGQLIPTGVLLPESDSPVDDIEAETQQGCGLYFQAKKTLQLSRSPTSELGKTMAQCCKYALDPKYDLRSSRLVIVVGRETGRLRHLQNALDRLQAPKTGRFSKAESDALSVVTGHLADLDQQLREEVLAALQLVVLDMERESTPRVQALAWLRTLIVEPKGGDPTLAWKIIHGCIRERAARRLGTDLRWWRQQLRDAGLTLVGDKARHLPTPTLLSSDPRASQLLKVAGMLPKLFSDDQGVVGQIRTFCLELDQLRHDHEGGDILDAVFTDEHGGTTLPRKWALSAIRFNLVEDALRILTTAIQLRQRHVDYEQRLLKENQRALERQSDAISQSLAILRGEKEVSTFSDPAAYGLTVEAT